MAAGPLSVPGAKATLFLSLSLTMLGFSGVMLGYYQVAPRPHDAPPMESQLEAELLDSNVPQALGTANLLASGLLVIASFLLTGRRESALWWTTQALLANILYTLGATASQLWHIHTYGPELVLLALSRAESSAEAQAVPPEVLSSLPWFAGGLAVLMGLAMIAIYLVLLKVARRLDVRAFVLNEGA